MKLKKILTVIALAVPMMFNSITSSNAGILDAIEGAAGDSALLAQQIAQFLNDISMDETKWQDVSRKFDQLRTIVGRVSNGNGNIYSVTKSAATTAYNIERVVYSMDNLRKYISYYDANGMYLTNAYSIYIKFSSNAGSIMTSSQKVYKEIASIFTQGGTAGGTTKEVADAFAKAMDEVDAEINKLSEECTDDLLKVVEELDAELESQINEYCFGRTIC